MHNISNMGLPTEQFESYIHQGILLSQKVKINWDMGLSEDGTAINGDEWDLRKIVNDGNPTQVKLRLFGTISKIIPLMIENGLIENNDDSFPMQLSKEWQNLIKSYVLQNLLINRKSISYVTSLALALRLMATVVKNKAPYLLDADDIRHCINIAQQFQKSGQAAILIGAFTKTVLDTYHICIACPISPLIENIRLKNKNLDNYRAAQYLQKEKISGKRLEQRKNEEKLPEKQAFWELMRIIFTEKPRTFMDAIRFAQAKVLVITGLRIGEVALLPTDWKRIIEYKDRDGRSAGHHGGFSHALLLRHFAEKQGSSRRSSGSLYETSQFVPRMFEDVLTETLNDIEKLTAPLRITLKNQCETGRFFYQYSPEELIPFELFYLHMTGMVIYKKIDANIYQPYIDRYRESFDYTHLEDLFDIQSQTNDVLKNAFYQFAIRSRAVGFKLRDRYGMITNDSGPLNKYVLVSDAEEYIKTHASTKLSDTKPFTIEGGKQLQPWEFLFLIPKRALGEGRDNLPFHPGKNLGVGIATSEILADSLSIKGKTVPTLFHNYGKTKEDKELFLLSHSLRHLQNTELFRMGVADTIITKRFNRRSVAQSYEYDHRSLQEELDQIELPDEWEAYLGDKAGTVAKMIELERANGPIVKEFKRLRQEEGDESAYSYLKAEADGFHATPYGHCMNSFTVDPCPTHLECFNGCVHLSATNLPENRQHLVTLQGKLKDAIEAAKAKPTSSIGRDNQIAHAETRYNAVTQILSTETGQRVFPNGQDLSQTNIKRSVLHGT